MTQIDEILFDIENIWVQVDALISKRILFKQSFKSI